MHNEFPEKNLAGLPAYKGRLLQTWIESAWWNTPSEQSKCTGFLFCLPPEHTRFSKGNLWLYPKADPKIEILVKEFKYILVGSGGETGKKSKLNKKEKTKNLYS